MRKLILLVAVAAVGVGVWKFRGTHQKPDPQLVENRIWIDHMPRNDRDQISVFAALSDESFGVFGKQSAWKGEFEIFQYEGHGGELRLTFPQDGDHEKVRAKASACGDKGFDYCLEISGSSRGVKRYYSMEGWEIDSLDQKKLYATIHR
jgi:hypothetical protein